MALIITALSFAFVSVVVLITFRATAGDSAVEVRLRGLQLRSAIELRRAQKAQTSALQQILIALGQFGINRNEKGITAKLTYSDMRSQVALPMFLGIRTLLSFGPATVIMLPKFISGQAMGNTLKYGIAAFALGHLGSNYWLSQKSQARIRSITESLPDVLDLLVVCLEAGLGLNAAIQRVGDERSNQQDPLGKELSQVHGELRAGRERDETFHDLGTRNGCEDLRSLTALIIQSQRLGASMGDTLRAHAELLRTKRRQRAEEAARKLPIKVLIPLATLLLPPLFIVVLAPAFLKFADVVIFLSNGS